MAYLPELHYCCVCREYLGMDNGDGICGACEEEDDMELKPTETLVASWDNGAFCSIEQRHSLLSCSTFVADLVQLVRQFGSPNKVEIRVDHEPSPGFVDSTVQRQHGEQDVKVTAGME